MLKKPASFVLQLIEILKVPHSENTLSWQRGVGGYEMIASGPSLAAALPADMARLGAPGLGR